MENVVLLIINFFYLYLEALVPTRPLININSKFRDALLMDSNTN
jgi:hypothetical protein